MKSMTDSLLQCVNKILEIDKKIAQIDRIELKNKIIVSEIDNKISEAALFKKIS